HSLQWFTAMQIVECIENLPGLAPKNSLIATEAVESIVAFHTYDCTNRDLTCAYELVSDGGVLVVHDCSPPNEAWASPMFAASDWSRRVFSHSMASDVHCNKFRCDVSATALFFIDLSSYLSFQHPKNW